MRLVLPGTGRAWLAHLKFQSKTKGEHFRWFCVVCYSTSIFVALTGDLHCVRDAVIRGDYRNQILLEGRTGFESHLNAMQISRCVIEVHFLGLRLKVVLGCSYSSSAAA